MRLAKNGEPPSEHPLTTQKRKTLMRIRKALVAVGILTGSALAANLAFAAWTANGTGSGSAKAISSVGVSTVSATPTAQLYPGGSGDVKITIKNDNSFPVQVTAINGTGAIPSADSTCD